MPFLQKKPQIETSAPLYTLRLNKTVLVVGLGNEGKEFEHTRHNIGFECIDVFVESQDFAKWIFKKDLKCLYTDATLGSSHVIAIKPTTLMNLSGESVMATANFYNIGPENIVVIHDELDIPFGQIRTRIGGSSAGHNGIKSVIQHLSEDFGRVRVGIGPKTPENIDSAAFVLAKFTKDEQDNLKPIRNEVSAIITEYIFSAQLPNETRNVIV